MNSRNGRSVAKTLLIALSLAACGGREQAAGPGVATQAGRELHGLETKPWHVSADWHASDISSTAYPEVQWSVIEQLQPGMSAARAKELLGDLQSYHHPVNAIAFARNPADGWRYEIALKLSTDGSRIEDLSFKHVEREPTVDIEDQLPREK